MGRHKKIQEEPKQEPKQEPIKKKKKIFRVRIGAQWRDFDVQKDARDYARKLLESDAIYYMSCTEEFVEEKP